MYYLDYTLNSQNIFLYYQIQLNVKWKYTEHITRRSYRIETKTKCQRKNASANKRATKAAFFYIFVNSVVSV